MDENPPTERQNPHALSNEVAARIRAHRKRLGLTREDLARECAKHGAPELTFAALTNIETGRPDPETGVRRRCITIDELAVIGDALGGVPLMYLGPCPVCHGMPSPGFTCRTCGAEA